MQSDLGVDSAHSKNSRAQCTNDASLLDVHRLDQSDTRIQEQPFAFLIAERQLAPSRMADLARDFPQYAAAGFFPHQPDDCGPSVNRLIEELTSPDFAEAIGTRLGVPGLAALPSLVTLCCALNKRHGTIHTDSRSKVVTALLYLSESWPGTSAGCLRLLERGDDIDALVVPEVPPLYGNLVAFRRADNSFHGHLPFEGERHVIQVAWLTSEAEKQRKAQRGTFSRWLKKLLGAIDRRFGAGRDRNSAHAD